ncbi:MAG: hypothetical protein LBT20_02205 [Clostridiales bacterium]|jgi:hypothetical protein|nr:hypothetical protein [Clostridiales bacterium]
MSSIRYIPQNEEKLIRFFEVGGVIDGDLISFDIGLYDFFEIDENDVKNTERVFAVSFDLDADFNDNDFTFVGFDLVEEFSNISAINNCGDWDGIIFNKNKYSLIQNKDDALALSQKLVSEFPEEPHADTEVVKLWVKGLKK